MIAMETKNLKERCKTKCVSAIQDRADRKGGGGIMKKLLILLFAVGLMIGLSACGATVRQSVKAPPSGDRGAIEAGPDEHLASHAYQNDEWIEDTPFGY
jgi:hypothetical protein